MPAIALAPELLVGLVLMILAFAAVTMFRPLLAGALSQLPVVGGWISARVNGLLLSILGSATGAVDAGVLVVGDLIHALFEDVWSHRLWTNGAFDHAYAALARVTFQLIPHVWASLGAHIDFVWASLGAHIDDVWRWSTDYTTRVWAASTDYTTRVWAATTAHTDAVWAALGAHVDAVWAATTAHTDAVWASLGDHIDAVWAQATAYALSLVTAETVRALQAERALQVGATAAAAGAVATAENLFSHEMLRALAAEAAGAAAAAAATAAVAVRVTEIEDSPCQTFCAPLGDLGGLLQGLEDAALLAAILAMAARAAHDPAGTARDLEQLEPVVGDLVQAGRQLVGA